MRLALDLRAFWASAVRDWRQLRRYPTTLIFTLFWPLVLPAVYVYQAKGFGGGSPAALQAFADRAGTAEVAGFLYVGGAMYMWLSVILWGPGAALRQEQQRGTLEELFLTPVARAVIIFGTAPGAIIQVVWMFVVILVALRIVFGVTFGPLEVVRAFAVLAIATPVLIAGAGLFATGVLRLKEVAAAVQGLRGLFQMLCGITFPIVVLPGLARDAALALPPTYVIADIRAVLLSGASLASRGTDLLILALMGVGFGGLALWSFSRAERHARRSGSLGRY